MKISYNWLKCYIPEAPEAEKLVDIFNYHLCEVEGVERKENGDFIFDINILPNRAHDLLSHQGVARELASLLKIKFVDPTPKYKIPESKPTKLKIEVDNNKCRRYMGRIIRNVKIGPSPKWVVEHLASIGQRSINNLVDAANIVMFDCGQPTHVFDLNKIKERLVVRLAKEGEEMTTLDNKMCKLNITNLVISDALNVLAIAGVKGGKVAEVDDGTTDVILEVANFDAVSVRKTAQTLNIFTDAKKRFENDLSPELCPYAMLEFSALILEMCKDAVFEEIVDVYLVEEELKSLSFSVDRMSEILGADIKTETIEDILKRYNFKHTRDGRRYEILVPPMRLDLVIEEDIAEEVGRIMGYDKILGSIPKISFKPKINETYAKISAIRNKLLQGGYGEVINTTFRSSGDVSVLASASDKNFLRNNLADGLKDSLKLNQVNAPLLGLKDIKIFEIGTVFKKSGEEMHVAYGDKKDIKEMALEEFYKSASLDAFAQSLSTSLYSATPSQKHTSSAFKMWPLFPFIARDVAVWVPENITSLDVKKIIRENMGEMIVRGPELFDEFRKNDKVSYAFRLVFQSYERTLTDKEVNYFMEKIHEGIKEKNWQVR